MGAMIKNDFHILENKFTKRENNIAVLLWMFAIFVLWTS